MVDVVVEAGAGGGTLDGFELNVEFAFVSELKTLPTLLRPSKISICRDSSATASESSIFSISGSDSVDVEMFI